MAWRSSPAFRIDSRLVGWLGAVSVVNGYVIAQRAAERADVALSPAA